MTTIMKHIRVELIFILFASVALLAAFLAIRMIREKARRDADVLRLWDHLHNPEETTTFTMEDTVDVP